MYTLITIEPRVSCPSGHYISCCLFQVVIGLPQMPNIHVNFQHFPLVTILDGQNQLYIDAARSGPQVHVKLLLSLEEEEFVRGRVLFHLKPSPEDGKYLEWLSAREFSNLTRSLEIGSIWNALIQLRGREVRKWWELLSLDAFLGDGKYLESENLALSDADLHTNVSVIHGRGVEAYLH